MNNEKWVVYTTWPNFFILENKVTVKGFYSHFNSDLCQYAQWSQSTLKKHPTLPSLKPTINYDQGSYRTWNQPCKPIKNLLQVHPQPSSSKFTATNHKWIFNYSKFDFYNALGQQLQKALYLSDVINMHQWQWNHRKTEWTGYLEY